MVKKVAVQLLGVVALLAVAGCAGRTSTAPSAAVPPPIDVAGTWTGSAGVAGPPVTMTLQQSGTKVTGDLRVAGRADISGPVTGTIQGNTIRLESTTSSAPPLTVQGDRMTGIVRGATLDLRRSR